MGFPPTTLTTDKHMSRVSCEIERGIDFEAACRNTITVLGKASIIFPSWLCSMAPRRRAGDGDVVLVHPPDGLCEVPQGSTARAPKTQVFITLLSLIAIMSVLALSMWYLHVEMSVDANAVPYADLTLV